jgi:hypothetical protein
MAFLKEWVTSNWNSNISKKPLIRLLARGWFAFIFSSREDVNWVLIEGLEYGRDAYFSQKVDSNL